MFHPPQMAIGLALLPIAWVSSDAAAQARSSSARSPSAVRRAADEDLARYFPAGWQRESLPDWPAAAAPVLRNVRSKWQGSALAAVFRRRVDAVWRALRQLGPRRGSSRG